MYEVEFPTNPHITQTSTMTTEQPPSDLDSTIVKKKNIINTVILSAIEHNASDEATKMLLALKDSLDQLVELPLLFMDFLTTILDVGVHDQLVYQIRLTYRDTLGIDKENVARTVSHGGALERLHEQLDTENMKALGIKSSTHASVEWDGDTPKSIKQSVTIKYTQPIKQ